MPTEALHLQDIASAEDMLSLLRRSNARWWTHGTDKCPWVFRGVGDANNWQLIPSAWRSSNSVFAALRTRVRAARLRLPHDAGTSEVLRIYYEWQAAEQEAIYRFASLADSIGISLPKSEVGHLVSPLLSGAAVGLRGNGNPPNIPLFALAQHHGLPTRLLDWTESPMTAAYFAVSPIFRPSASSHVCVWAIDTSAITTRGFQPFQFQVHSPPRSDNRYLHSQAGVLTELLGHEQFFIQHSRWPSLEEVFASREAETPILVGFKLSATEADRLAVLLDREGVHDAALRPSLDNVARTVCARWQSESGA